MLPKRFRPGILVAAIVMVLLGAGFLLPNVDNNLTIAGWLLIAGGVVGVVLEQVRISKKD
ncbi:hypothetical protein AX769_05790 [Frondihabitans sp. PAMC 28766]|uniref:hypothetical protein n=1 Tax=Frondihabitans sp. PAMC 28766 TaxID=1795630 RepID=UPI00078C9A67|nr:hypothetical protein [Frondihabitans sp. PAMC 28766]AMM19749.1 hypothetical protein AX769_05790 [Frondihabitans sp. PAMC 28766]